MPGKRLGVLLHQKTLAGTPHGVVYLVLDVVGQIVPMIARRLPQLSGDPSDPPARPHAGLRGREQGDSRAHHRAQEEARNKRQGVRFMLLIHHQLLFTV